MSIAAAPISADSIAAQNRALAATANTPPRTRQVVAKTDSVTAPEAR